MLDVVKLRVNRELFYNSKLCILIVIKNLSEIYTNVYYKSNCIPAVSCPEGWYTDKVRGLGKDSLLGSNLNELMDNEMRKIDKIIHNK